MITKDLLYEIAKQIYNARTFYNFALTCKMANNVCRMIPRERFVKYAYRRYFGVLPNGWKHGWDILTEDKGSRIITADLYENGQIIKCHRYHRPRSDALTLHDLRRRTSICVDDINIELEPHADKNYDFKILICDNFEANVNINFEKNVITLRYIGYDDNDGETSLLCCFAKNFINYTDSTCKYRYRVEHLHKSKKKCKCKCIGHSYNQN